MKHKIINFSVIYPQLFYQCQIENTILTFRRGNSGCAYGFNGPQSANLKSPIVINLAFLLSVGMHITLRCVKFILGEIL